MIMLEPLDLVGLGGLEPPISSLSVEFKRLPDEGACEVK